MPLDFQIWVGKQQWGGDNVPSLVGKGLTETLNSEWAKAHPAHPLRVSLFRYTQLGNINAAYKQN